MKTRAKKEHPRAAGPTTVHNLPDHLITLILLRLDSSATLIRAAATCKLWRRTITGTTGFLTQYRALNAPCVAGHYHAFHPDWIEYGETPITGNPVFVPSSSNNNNTIVDSRRFSLDFLPESEMGWAIADSHGSLLLLFKRGTGGGFQRDELVVCDPLTRRYQGILCPGSINLDGDDDDNNHAKGSGGVSNFRVVLVDYFNPEPEGYYYKPEPCVFSLGNDDGGWRELPSASTNGITLPELSMTFAGRVNGSLYWVTGEDGAMLVLDKATTTFSWITFPPDTVGGSYDKWTFRVIGGDDGKLRVVRMINSNLMVFAQRHQQGSDDDEEWVIEKFLRLPEAAGDLPGREEYWYFQRNAMIVAAHDKYILVTPQEKTCLFSVELDTLKVEREHERNKYPGQAYPCELPWPPVLEAYAGDDHGQYQHACCGPSPPRRPAPAAVEPPRRFCRTLPGPRAGRARAASAALPGPRASQVTPPPLPLAGAPSRPGSPRLRRPPRAPNWQGRAVSTVPRRGPEPAGVASPPPPLVGVSTRRSWSACRVALPGPPRLARLRRMGRRRSDWR
ncbi:hypothetical protein PR202_ga16140 [Eleusine coracana subsp. coracana]|uniref:F-box domain-containing protein n=1 Tax=Eleusine coracana subsp. coracana TaxID=191504 RepID=A0AAV5CLF6_ELECO|nr:hypothetical protein PR202_ga16140 [Eleusine coracana subsp. coracana]